MLRKRYFDLGAQDSLHQQGIPSSGERTVSDIASDASFVATERAFTLIEFSVGIDAFAFQGAWEPRLWPSHACEMML